MNTNISQKYIPTSWILEQERKLMNSKKTVTFWEKIDFFQIVLVAFGLFILIILLLRYRLRHTKVPVRRREGMLYIY